MTMFDPEARWNRLSQLLKDIDRGVAAAAQLDVHDHTLPPRSPIRIQAALDFDVLIVALEAKMKKELNRLTVERGAVDLAERKRLASALRCRH